ncbi:hypothetical protein GOODEAATRI_009188, partial [Goodea atripinnis]
IPHECEPRFVSCLQIMTRCGHLFFRHHLQQQAPTLCPLRLLKTSPTSHSDAIATPALDGAPKQYSLKIQQLVNDIASLNLLEVSDLNELLKVCGKVILIPNPNHSSQLDS